MRQKTAALKKAAEGLRNQGDDKEEESKSNDGANANGADGDVVMMDSWYGSARDLVFAPRYQLPSKWVYANTVVKVI